MYRMMISAKNKNTTKEWDIEVSKRFFDKVTSKNRLGRSKREPYIWETSISSRRTW